MKRLLSLLLILCMMLSTLGISALATDGEPQEPTTETGSSQPQDPPTQPENQTPPDPPVHEHSLSTVKTEPTCTASGATVSTCSGCDYSSTETIDAIGHSWQDVEVIKEATCNEEGAKLVECSVCHETEEKPIAKTEEHSWNEGEVTTQPTPEAEGVMTYSCTVCGGTKTEAVAKLEAEKKPDDIPLLKSPTRKYSIAPGAKNTGISVSLKVASAVYDGTNHILKFNGINSLNITGLDDGNEYSAVLDFNASTITDVETYSIAVSIKDSSDNVIYSTTLQYEITPATLTVTPEAKTKIYGADDPELTYSVSGQQGTDTEFGISGALGREAGTDVGKYAINMGTLSCSNKNYTLALASEPVYLTIAKAASSITTPPGGIVGGLKYNGKAQALVTAGKAEGGTMMYSLDGTNFSSAIPTATDSGTYTVYYKVQGDKNHEDCAGSTVTTKIATSAAEDVAKQIKVLASWLPGDQVDPGNKHQREQVLKAWAAYLNLSAAEQAKVPADLFDWLYYLVGNTDYAIISGNGGYWYEGRGGALSFGAIDPKHKLAAVYVNGNYVDSSNYSYYWYGVNEYGEEDILVVSLKPAYLAGLGVGKHSISISFTNGYAPGYFCIVESSASPRTGDDANIPLWAGLMMISMAALGTAAYTLKNKEE